MPNSRLTIGLSVLMLAALACGVTDKLGGVADNLKGISTLWDDVPRMEGLTASEEDLPLPIKLVVRTAVAELLAGGSGSGDWILFTTDKSSDDVKAFYTNDLMAEHGWEASDASTCVAGSEQGLSQVGTLCIFQKQAGSTYTGLLILGMAAEKAGQTNVIFIRVEGEQTPAPDSPGAPAPS